MYNYEIWTIAIPQDKKSNVREKFFKFMNDKDFDGLVCGAISLELEREENIEKVLESYATIACKESGFLVNE